MRKNRMMAALMALALLGSFSFSSVVSAQTNPAYWHEAKPASEQIEAYTKWMASLPDDKPLSALSVPGSHDTMAYGAHLPFGASSRTQTMSLEQQLLSGLRYVDIRLAYDTHSDQFLLYHGFVNLGFTFDDVLTTIAAFLAKHPTETVLMRIQQEHTEANDTLMRERFNRYYERYRSLFWHYSESVNRHNPTLGEIRGKICLLSDVLSISQGLQYRFFNIQDQYRVRTNWSLYEKWEQVKAQLQRSAGRLDGQIYVNHLSASGGSYPFFVASGHVTAATYGHRLSTGLFGIAFRKCYPDFPRSSRNPYFASILFEGTNQLTADYLRKHKLQRTGIVVADFPGEALIAEVIRCNFQ